VGPRAILDAGIYVYVLYLYDLFHILLLPLRTYGLSNVCESVCVCVCVCVCVHVHMYKAKG
jgi:hypothetical protein